MATARRKRHDAKRSDRARALPRRSTRRAKAGLPRRAFAGELDGHELNAAAHASEGYAALYQFGPVAYLGLDRNGVVEEINQAGCRLFGRTLTEVMGRPMVVLVAKESRTDFLDHMRRVRHIDGVIESDLLLQLRNGSVVPVRAYTKRLDHAGRHVMCWTTLIDLTERVRLEQARHEADEQRLRAERDEQLTRASSEAKDRFLAMLSHELRTPLAPALLAVNRLLAATQDESVGQLGEIIRRNIEIEAHLINDLLDVTRIGRGRLDVQLEPANVHSIIVEAIEIVRAQADRKRIRVSTDLAARSHHILADASRMRQVFWNLLINAIKYSDRGHIEVLTVDDVGGGIRVTVTDTGVGMDQVTLAKLFRPFEQHVSTSGGSHRGLGLGLAICKGIIDVHGGRIWATSAGLGLGSAFEIDLPTVESRPAPPVLDHASDRRAPRRPVRHRVLLVEDDPDTAAMLEILLRSEGHDVSVAPDLRHALERSEETWDVVLSDLGLPDGSGLEVARRMRSAAPRPRLIALSGYGAPHDVVRTREAGFDEHLVKPLDFGLLKNLLRTPK